MSIELHNFTWEKVRLVQVETQPHQIAGVLASIRDTLENSDCEWEDIYSASYDCEEDGTTTFYEGVTLSVVEGKAQKQAIREFEHMLFMTALKAKKKS